MSSCDILIGLLLEEKLEEDSEGRPEEAGRVLALRA